MPPPRSNVPCPAFTERGVGMISVAGESFRQAAKSRQQTGSRYAKCFMTLFECYGCLQADILRRRADGDDEVALFHHAAALRVDKRQRFVSERKAYLPLFARCEPDAPEAAELSGRAYRRGDHVRDVELYDFVAFAVRGVAYAAADFEDVVAALPRFEAAVFECRVTQPVTERIERRGREIGVVVVRRAFLL